MIQFPLKLSHKISTTKLTFTHPSASVMSFQFSLLIEKIFNDHTWPISCLHLIVSDL